MNSPLASSATAKLIPSGDSPGDVISERKATVAQALQGVKSARYTYDFGDGWEHEIKVEAPLAKYLDLKAPVCVDGKKACPPEDCGGPPGYEDFLRTMADPADPEHDAMTEWAGRVWDATEFNLDVVNQALGRLRCMNEATTTLTRAGTLKYGSGRTITFG